MMEVHIDLDEEELAYVEENGLTEILQENLGQVKKFTKSMHLISYLFLFFKYLSLICVIV